MDHKYVDMSINFSFANESCARKPKNVPVIATPTLHVAFDEKETIDHAQIISVARIAKRLKQTELARQLYVKVRDVREWESGASTPTSRQQEHIMRILNCTFSPSD